MRKKTPTLFHRISILTLIVITFSACQQQTTSSNYSTNWPKATTENKPWTRWWWLGNAVDSANLNANLTDLANAGVGGVEITPLYGVKGYEDQFIDHLSPKWMEMLGYTVSEARELGMKVDMVQGTGWPFGGPHVTPQHAASKLIVQTYYLKPNSTLKEPITVRENKQEGLATLDALLVFGNGSYIEDVTSKLDANNKLNYTSGKDPITIYAVFCGKTRQQVKRAAPGGEGYTLDHYSKEALDAYLKPYEETIGKDQTGLRALFNDSYEVYGTTWTSGFMDQFKTLRGYDLRPYIPVLISNDHTDLKERVLSDYRETISDLLLNNFLNPWREWAHSHHYMTKNQSHGSPGNLLDLYGAVDIPECETFGSTPFEIKGLRRDSIDVRAVDPDPVMLKFASSAANVHGKKLVSSESFTWLREHFRGALSHCKPELEQLWLSGVNHVFFHGTTYSPKEDVWPGWKFYASMNFHPNNPIWKDAPAFFEYITRCQSILQSSQSNNDLLVYWPIYDEYDDTEVKKLLQFGVHEIVHWMYPTDFYKVSTALADNGFSYDFVSDAGLQLLSAQGKQIVGKGTNPYKAIVLPTCNRIPAETFNQLLTLANSGATLVIQQFPNDVPGLSNLERERAKLKALIDRIKQETDKQQSSTITWGSGKIIIGNKIPELLNKNAISGEEITECGLKFIKKKMDEGFYYYVVNHTARTINKTLTFSEEAASVVLMDPQNGETGIVPFEIKNGKTKVLLQLKSGESIFVKLLNKKITGKSWNYYAEKASEIMISGVWDVQFIEGGPTLPNSFSMDKLGSWTSSSIEAENFAGTASYSTTFDMPDQLTTNYELYLGDVRETARVFINGDSAGIAWSNPYVLKVGQFLKPGINTIKIEVTNLGANRIRDLDTRGVIWKKFYNTNIVTVAYKPFDASTWDVVPSGLIGPVTLKPLEILK